jgi:hypothetical protein
MYLLPILHPAEGLIVPTTLYSRALGLLNVSIEGKWGCGVKYVIALKEPKRIAH